MKSSRPCKAPKAETTKLALTGLRRQQNLRAQAMSLDAVHAALLASYESDGGINHLDGVNLPAQESVNTLARDCMHLLFPGYFDTVALEKSAVPAHVGRLLSGIDSRLNTEIEKCLRFARQTDPAVAARTLTAQALAQLPELRRIIQTDVTAAYQGDPAARSVEEIILAYPCVLAISLQRIAHVLYRLGVPLLPRMLTEYAHERTGTDIHPGARIGPHFFIDHATGVAPADVVVVNGNHDETLTWALHRLLVERYQARGRVTIDEKFTPRKYLDHGRNLLGFCHGHRAKRKLPQLMAIEAAKAWARCPYREIHTGHLHHQAAEWSRPIETLDGVLVRVAPSLGPADDYHAVNGWLGQRRAMELFVYDEAGGLVAMHVAGPRLEVPS